VKKTLFYLILLLFAPLPARGDDACDKATTAYDTASQACQKVLRACLGKCPADANGKSDLRCIAAKCPGMNETCHKVTPAMEAVRSACWK